MRIQANESSVDRWVRVVFGTLLVVCGVFWVSGVAQTLSVLLGAVLVVTGLIGFCPLYALFKTGTRKAQDERKPRSPWLFGLVFVVLLVAASAASVYITRKQFLENFNAMNTHYKQALFQTGQQNREQSVKDYQQLVTTYADFSQRYSTYHPYTVWGDTQFNSDLSKVDAIIADANTNVTSGDLAQAHIQLEQVRPIFQELFKRNGFSMLSMSLVDFHDTMEKLIDASEQKDTQEVVRLYAEADQYLKAVEAEVNDEGIQAIRQNLDSLLKLAQDGNGDDLAKQAGNLKTSFVKVYLIRG